MNWLPIARKLRLVFGAVSLVLSWQALLIIDRMPLDIQLLYGIFLSAPTVGILLLALFLRYEARRDDPANVIRPVWIDTVGYALWTIVLLAFILFEQFRKTFGGGMRT